MPIVMPLGMYQPCPGIITASMLNWKFAPRPLQAASYQQHLMTAVRHRRLHIVLALAVVYVFWGSTYLAIRIAVEYIPAELMTALRFGVAGLVMLAFCALTERRVAIAWRSIVQQAIIGVLLLSISNVTLAWSERYVRTGLASLIVACVPIWFLVIDTWLLRGDHVSLRGLAGLALGIIGIVVLIWPKLTSPPGTSARMELYGSLSLIGSSLVWAVGSVASRRWQSGADAFVATGWQMTIAALVNLMIAFAVGDFVRTNWAWQGLAAVAYLIVFGSWVGYSAYIWLLNNLPTAKVGTYAFVNPICAVFLGWLFLHEQVDGYILAGTATVIVGVALAITAKIKPRREIPSVEPKLPACEQGAD